MLTYQTAIIYMAKNKEILIQNFSKKIQTKILQINQIP